MFGQEKGTKLNVNEFINAFDNPNNPYIKRVPDIAKNLKASYDNFTQKDVNKMSQFISEETVTNSVGDKVEVKFMTPQQQDKLEDALKGRKITGTDYYSGGQFKKMLELNGNAIWEDIMPDEITLRDKNWGTWQPKSIDDPEYDEFYEKQYKPSLEYLGSSIDLGCHVPQFLSLKVISSGIISSHIALPFNSSIFLNCPPL